jgi:hypothetical protein
MRITKTVEGPDGKTITYWESVDEDEIERKAKARYAELKDVLEPEHRGEAVLIEVDSGNYYLGRRLLDAWHMAKEEHPNGIFFGFRIGYKAYASYRGGRR